MIEFQFFNGCPNSEETLKNLRELITDGVIDKNELIITEVPDFESAERLNFQGSPTILLNERDIYTGLKPESFNYSCRVYLIDGNQTGVLSKDYIKDQIEKLHG